MTMIDQWGEVVSGNIPPELAQVVDYWQNQPNLNSEPKRPSWLRRFAHKVADGLAWLGKPYVTAAYEMPSGVLFGADGQIYSDRTVASANGLRPEFQDLADRIWSECAPKTHRVPAPPWPGWEWREGTDELTGWPYHQLVKVLPEGCAGCESL